MRKRKLELQDSIESILTDSLKIETETNVLSGEDDHFIIGKDVAAKQIVKMLYEFSILKKGKNK
jgi:hypothetical protein